MLTGRVVSVREFGAFVDLGGGVQGLLHVSEMGWSRVADASQVVKPGDEITVKVLRIDDENSKIALGLKQLTADPWSTVEENYEVGQVREGRVTRLADFGAFVELEPGIEALAHVSTFPPTGHGRTAGPRPSPSARPGRSRSSARSREEADRRGDGARRERARECREHASTYRAGARLTGKVERHENYGVFVFLAPGGRGSYR